MDIFLNSIFQSLVPKDKKFVPLFIQASSNVVTCAQTLYDTLRAEHLTRSQRFKEIAALEQQGDEITHTIMSEVAATFIIPFDREDIQALALTLDDVADYIYAIAKRMELYKIHEIPPFMLDMSTLILEAAKELDQIIRKLHDLRYTHSMQESLARIREWERNAGDLHGDAIAALFKETNAIEILKQKEVYLLFYSAVHRVEATASVIESVLVKFS